MSGQRDTDTAALAATLGAAVMITYQVAAKATRQALFLSCFTPDSLAPLIAGASLFSILLGMITSRVMAAVGPSRLIPFGFAASGLFQLVEWAASFYFPRTVAAVFYLHLAGLAAVLISGFWSLLNERFDPHTARQRIARITGGAAAGSLAGGGVALIAGSPRTMLPVLSAMHLVCAAMLWSIPRRTGGPGPVVAGSGGGFRAGVRLIRAHRFLFDLALLVFLGAAASTMIEIVFVTRAHDAIAKSGHLAFFALFYTGSSIITCVIQAILTGSLLEKAGLGITSGAHPATIALGSLGAALGGIGSVTAARGSEQVVYNSLFRSAYELFYTPLPPAEKRCAKPLIDVTVVRLGDLAGSAVRSLSTAQPLLLGVAAGAGLAGLWITRRLDRGYVTALEKSLRERAVDLKVEEVADHTTRATFVRTMAEIQVSSGTRPPTRMHVPAAPQDPVLLRIADLRAGDPDRVRQALSAGPLMPPVVPYAIALLGWDELAGDAMRALRAAGAGITGQLADALLDGATEFAIRRRIPRVLEAFSSTRACDALRLGLNDKRFEVRYRCGRALATMRELDPGLELSPAIIYGVVSRELEVDKQLWKSRRLLDRIEEDQLVGDRADRGLEHVFTLLALILPKKPLQIAFYALHTDDAMLRGTALEYLDSVLPPPVRDRLRLVLDDTGSKDRPRGGDVESLNALLKSHESIQARLLELRAQKDAAMGTG